MRKINVNIMGKFQLVPHFLTHAGLKKARRKIIRNILTLFSIEGRLKCYLARQWHLWREEPNTKQHKKKLYCKTAV